MLALLELEATPASARVGSARRGHHHRVATPLEGLTDAFERSPSHHHHVETRFAIAKLRMNGEPRLGRGVWICEEPLERGVILGCVELSEIVRDSTSPWALPNHFHWVLRRPMLLVNPVSWTGSLGLSWIRPPQGKLVAARRSRTSYRKVQDRDS